MLRPVASGRSIAGSNCGHNTKVSLARAFHKWLEQYYRFCHTLLIYWMSVSLLHHFLPVLSLETSVCSILMFSLVFLGS